MSSAPQHWAKCIPIHDKLDEGALDDYFKSVRDKLTADMVFARRPISRRFWVSGLLRAAALAALAAGLLLPILVPERVEFLRAERSGAEMALVAVILGGLILLADQLFNVSRSWARLMLTELKLKSVRETLEMEWAKRRPAITAENAAADGVALIELLQAALTEGTSIMTTQKQTWAAELDEATASLRSQLESHRGTLDQTVREQREEAARPTTGAVNIAIDKPQDLKGPVKLFVNGVEKGGSPAPAASLSLRDLPVGQATIAVESERNTTPPTPFHSSNTVNIESGAIATLAIRV